MSEKVNGKIYTENAMLSPPPPNVPERFAAPNNARLRDRHRPVRRQPCDCNRQNRQRTNVSLFMHGDVLKKRKRVPASDVELAQRWQMVEQIADADAGDLRATRQNDAL